MSFFQRQPPQLASSPFSSSIFGNISLLSQQQQEASRAFLGESKVMDSDMRLQSMDETLSDNEQDDSQSDKVSTLFNTRDMMHSVGVLLSNGSQ